MEFLSQLHPLIVHFPIAFFFLYIILELVNFFLKKNEVEKIILSLLLLGVISGILSVLTGNQTLQYLTEFSSLTQLHTYLIDKHEFSASITIWYFFALLILKYYFLLKKKNDALLHYIFVIFALGGLLLLFNTAKWGGILVYKFGIGTELLK